MVSGGLLPRTVLCGRQVVEVARWWLASGYVGVHCIPGLDIRIKLVQLGHVFRCAKHWAWRLQTILKNAPAKILDLGRQSLNIESCPYSQDDT